MSQLKTAGRKEFPLVIKADVQGSLEAILGSLEKLGTDEVAARILHAGVGGITESDVTLAEASTPRSSASTSAPTRRRAAAAKRNGIEIRYYNIIYDLVDDVKKAMSGLLAPTLRETLLGNAADPGSVQHLQGRQGRRLPGHRRHRGTRRQCAPDPRQRRRARRQAVDAEALQGRSEGSASPARNAAWRSRTTTTCAPATSSSVIAWRRSSARCKSKSYEALGSCN